MLLDDKVHWDLQIQSDYVSDHEEVQEDLAK